MSQGLRSRVAWPVGAVAALASIALLCLGAPTPVAAQAGAASAKPDPSFRVALQPLASCKKLRSYLLSRPQALDASSSTPPGPIGVPGPGAPGAGGGADVGTPTSTPTAPTSTNVQETGVDEPDIVKAQRSTIFSVSGSTLRAVGTAGGTPVVLGTLALPDGEGFSISYELLLAGDRLLAIGSANGGFAPALAPELGTSTVLAEINISNPGGMVIRKTEVVEGSFVSGRLTGRTARLVINNVPDTPVPVPAQSRQLLPTVLRGNPATGKIVRRRLGTCRDVSRPSQFAGAEMLSVLTIDLERGLPAIDVDSVMTNGQIVYASTRNLYVATERWIPEGSDASRFSRITTEIHRFDISDPDATSYVASGEVDGFMLSQWSMSEHERRLRVASTSSPPWFTGAGTSESAVTVLALARDPDRLQQVGRVGGLGRGERIYAVRFIAERGYVVTFRQVDPLYVIDLSDPTAPRVAGELEIPGYSAYLHPVGSGLLLGIGQDANEFGQRLGVQASLFDVSDPANPRRVDQVALGGQSSTSEVESDHHAFSYFPQYALAVVPLYSYGPEPGSVAAGLRVTPGSSDPLTVAGQATHGTGTGFDQRIRRSVAVGNRVYTVSDTGIAAHDPGSLAQTGFAGF